MGSAKLLLKLSCFWYVWFGSLANDCGIPRKYEHGGRCCDVCPPGKFINKYCTQTTLTVCETCPVDSFSEAYDVLEECHKCDTCGQGASVERKCNSTANTKCSCNPGFVGTDDKCLECEEKKRCNKGEELKRTGGFIYSYKCEPCTNNTYSDTEDSTCKPLIMCLTLGLDVIFPGNRTHNAKCGIQDPEVVEDSILTQTVLAITLFVFVLVSLVLLLNICIQKAKNRRLNSMCRPSPLIMMSVPDTCSCQLSKEERGDEDFQAEHKVSPNQQCDV